MLTQTVGRFKINGEFFLPDLTCDGQTRTWEGYVNSANGYFRGGKAATVTTAFACGALECVDGYAEHTIQLRLAKR